MSAFECPLSVESGHWVSGSRMTTLARKQTWSRPVGNSGHACDSTEEGEVIGNAIGFRLEIGRVSVERRCLGDHRARRRVDPDELVINDDLIARKKAK